MLSRLAIAILLAFTLWVPTAFGQTKIFVASSLTDIFEAFAKSTNLGTFQIVPGGSSTLARQIRSGAPASLFVSANKDWATYVAGDREILPLFSNRLVVATRDKQPIDQPSDLIAALDGRRLAVAEPEHVPAGIYAQLALERSGVWSDLQSKLAPFDNVRAAARAVQIGAVPYGIVYRSDALALELDIAYEFSPDAYDPIVYWAVNIDPQSDDVAAILRLVKSEAARDIVERFGFELLGQEK